VARSIANRPYLIASQHRVSVAASEQLIPRQTNETETTLTPLSESSNRYGEKYYFKTPTRYHPDAIHPAQQGQSQRDLNLDISSVHCCGSRKLGHIADYCPNEPLSADRKAVIRKSILAERRKVKRAQSGREVSVRPPPPHVTTLSNNQNKESSLRRAFDTNEKHTPK